MKRTGIRGQGSGVSLLLFLLATPLVAQTSLSIYSDGRVVVRKTIPQKLQRGTNIFSLDLPGLDPATLFSPDSNVAVTSAVLRPATDADAAMRASVGRTLTFVRAKDTIQATVLSVSPPQFKMPNGLISFSVPGEVEFPNEAGLIRGKPEAVVTVDASRARDVIELAYISQGVTWEAVYQALLSGSGSATVNGAATISSTDFKVDSATVQLVAGSVNRARNPITSRDQFAPRGFNGVAMATTGALKASGYAAEETVGETHVYELPGPISLDLNTPVTSALFPKARADYSRDYIVSRGALPWGGAVNYDTTRLPVEVWYTFKRPRGTPFGDRPLPGGTMELFQRDSAGRVQLVGEATFGHTPVAKDLRVLTGVSFDVTAARVETDYRDSVLVPAALRRPQRVRHWLTYLVTLTNARREAITVDVREGQGGVWKVTQSTVPPEKLSAAEVRFLVPVPANGTATLTYTVQVDS